MHWFPLIWVFIGLLAAGTEGAAIALNDKSDAAGKPRELRTLTENIRLLGATDKDGARRRYRGLRRVGLLATMAWLTVHFLTNGSFV